MTSDRLNTRLPQALAEHVERVAGPQGMYETPSEYVRALIRQDMEEVKTNAYRAIIEGFEDIAEGRYVESSGDWKQDKLKISQKERDGWR